MKHDVFISFSFSDRTATENPVNILSGNYGMEKQKNADAAREHWEKARNIAQNLLTQDHPVLKEIEENLNR